MHHIDWLLFIIYCKEWLIVIRLSAILYLIHCIFIVRSCLVLYIHFSIINLTLLKYKSKTKIRLKSQINALFICPLKTPKTVNNVIEKYNKTATYILQRDKDIHKKELNSVRRIKNNAKADIDAIVVALAPYFSTKK